MIIKMEIPGEIELLEDEFLEELREVVEDTLKHTLRGLVRKMVTDSTEDVRSGMRARLSERFNQVLAAGVALIDDMTDEQIIEAAWEKAV
jgi:hypothetical protein